MLRKKYQTLSITFMYLRAFQLWLIFFLGMHNTAVSQITNSKEDEFGQNFSENWSNFNNKDFKISIDSLIYRKGNASVSIENMFSKSGFEAAYIKLPKAEYGNKISITCDIKAEGVKEGFAGLWIRIDPNITYRDMGNSGIVGTTKWRTYKLEIDLPKDRDKEILVGFMLAGHGKIWVDDFKVLIDGKHPSEYRAINDPTNFDSGIFHVPTDRASIQKLKEVAMIWGYLKYYHPNLSKGLTNWDKELFEILPKILEAKSQVENERIISEWIDSVGDYTTSEPLTVDSVNIKNYPSLNWIESLSFSNVLKSKVEKIKLAKRPDRNYYVQLHEGAGNPAFLNEFSYSYIKHPDVGYRLLGLFRYWNIIKYYFPYLNLLDKDWNNVLDDFIPRFINAKNQEEYHLTILELVGNIQDSHAFVNGIGPTLNVKYGNRYSAFELKIVDSKPIVVGIIKTGSRNNDGILKGDVISKINKIPIEKVIEDLIPYHPSSNLHTKYRDMSGNLLRSNDSTIEIEIIRDGIHNVKLINTFSPNEFIKEKKFTDSSFAIIENDIAYLNKGKIKNSSIEKYWKGIEKCKAIIIDLRQYPVDYPEAFCNLLLPNQFDFVKLSKGSIQNPGLFTFDKPLKVGKKNKNYFKGKVVIVVDEGTQSAGEWQTMAFQTHPKAIVVGAPTAGANGNISKITFPGGIQTWFSGIGVYYPNGKETQQVGIIPNIIVRPNLEDIKKGTDTILMKAIELANQ